jgi:DNA-directed RNA polymerase alpha subunit
MKKKEPGQILKTCSQGHQFYKSSDCPVCPVCEKAKERGDGFLLMLSAPARRALENQNIKSLKDLSKWSEKDILKLHGFGPASMPILKKALKQSGLNFK